MGRLSCATTLAKEEEAQGYDGLIKKRNPYYLIYRPQFFT
jgi:hypothetical protein